MSEVHVANALDSGLAVYWNVFRRLASSATDPVAELLSQAARAWQAARAETVAAGGAGAFAAA